MGTAETDTTPDTVSIGRAQPRLLSSNLNFA